MRKPEAKVTASRRGEPTSEGGTLLTERWQPERTCIGCRRRESAHFLLRLAVSGGQIVADPRRVLGGRGAWLHPTIACLEAASRRNAFGRALAGDASGAFDRLLPIVDSQGLTATR